MQTRSSKHSQQQVDLTIVEKPVITMADQCSMAELLRAPTEGYEEAIVVPEITAANFKIKHGLNYRVVITIEWMEIEVYPTISDDSLIELADLLEKALDSIKQHQSQLGTGLKNGYIWGCLFWLIYGRMSLLDFGLCNAKDKTVWRSHSGVGKPFSVQQVRKDFSPRIEYKMSVLRRIVVAAAVYYVWNEKNKRLFDRESRNVETITRLIIEYVKLKLMSLTVKQSVQVRKVARELEIVVDVYNQNAAATRNATIKLIGVLQKFVGPDIKAFLSHVKPALLSAVEAL
nr:protein MOR1 isoform X2 [Tanacetum cinerariifolium]